MSGKVENGKENELENEFKDYDLREDEVRLAIDVLDKFRVIDNNPSHDIKNAPQLVKRMYSVVHGIFDQRAQSKKRKRKAERKSRSLSSQESINNSGMQTSRNKKAKHWKNILQGIYIPSLLRQKHEICPSI